MKDFLKRAAIIVLSPLVLVALFWYYYGAFGVACLVALALVLLFARWAFLPQHKLPVNRVRYQRIRLRLCLHPGKGHATLFQLWWKWSRYASFRLSPRIRPSLPMFVRLLFANEHSVYLGKAQYRRRVRVDLQQNVIMLAPTRTGKSGTLGQIVLHAPGPVVSGSTRDDIFRLTSIVRRRFGAIHVFNPQQIGNLPSTFRWNPLEGCDDPATAIRRADALVYGAAGEQTKGDDQAWWTAKASSAMRSLLYAAAIAQKNGDAAAIDAGFDLVANWIMSGKFAGAIQVLESIGAKQFADNLSELMGPAERTTATIRMFMSRCISFMSDPVLAQAVRPRPGEGLDIDRFLTGKNTLYLIGEGQSNDAPLAPLYVALTSEIQFRAVQIGSQMPGGRLDPPLLLALDEATQTVPVPLPHWLADGAGKGIPCVVVAHGVAQLRKRYGDNGARAILDTAGTWLLLGGISDPQTLEMAEKLSGEVALSEHGHDASARHPVLSAEMVRELPDGFGVLLRGNLAPVVVRLPMAWKDRTYRRALKRRIPPVPVLAPWAHTVPLPAQQPEGGEAA